MKIHTRVVYDIETMAVLEDEWFEYEGEVALCNGDSTAQATEQIQEQNAQSQLNFENQLMGIFQQQYGNQQQVLSYLQNQMQPIINAGGTGYSAQALASMRTSATDNIADQYQNAKQALQQQQFATGGQDLPSGVDAQINASLDASQAATQSGAQNSITQANENLKQQNYWNAVNELNGVGASFNPQSYMSGATSAAGASASAGSSAASLSQANTAASSNSFFGKLAGGLGSSLGAGLGAGLSGGFGTFLSTLGSGNYGF